MSVNSFSPTSRYYGLPTANFELPDGRSVAYLRRRFVPDPSRFTTLTIHTVIEGERLDRLTYAYLGDPLQFWRLADSNGVLAPEDLEQPQKAVRISLPLDLPGVPGA